MDFECFISRASRMNRRNGVKLWRRAQFITAASLFLLVQQAQAQPSLNPASPNVSVSDDSRSSLILGQGDPTIRSDVSIIEQSHNGDVSGHADSAGKSLADFLFPETLMPGSTANSVQSGRGETSSAPRPPILSGGQNQVRILPEYNQGLTSGITTAMRLIADLEDALAREKLRAEATSLELARSQEQLASLKVKDYTWACHRLDPRGIGSGNVVGNTWPAFATLPLTSLEQVVVPQLEANPIDRQWPPLQMGGQNTDESGRNREPPEEQATSKAPGNSPSLTLTEIEEERLIRRAETLLRNNDLGSARLLLRGVAEMGSNRAHLLLAETYSPAMMSNCGTETGSSGKAPTKLDPCRAPSAGSDIR
jgi:hypothetical protein